VPLHNGVREVRSRGKPDIAQIIEE
jgi:hypothetical protein